MIYSQASLDWGYAVIILYSTASAMEIEVSFSYTFYGLILLKNKISAKVAPQANPVIPMKIHFCPKSFQKIE